MPGGEFSPMTTHRKQVVADVKEQMDRNEEMLSHEKEVN